MAPSIVITYPEAQWIRSAGNDLLADARTKADSIADGQGQRLIGADYTVTRDVGAKTYSIGFEAGPATGTPEALNIPAYEVADLPSAVLNAQKMVRVTDNPQGTAQSNGSVWISDVDGTDLGPGKDG